MLRLLAMASAVEWSEASLFQVDTTASARADAGRRQLEELLQEGSPQRSCWAQAVENLKAGCRSMDDTERSRLAVQFTNCHLQKSGLWTYPCTDAMDVAACTAPMVESPSGLAYSTYTLFYSHAESMCFYLQSAAFQEATELAVQRLHLGAHQAAQHLMHLRSKAAEMVSATASIISEQQVAAEMAASLLHGQQLAASELEALQRSQVEAFARSEHMVTLLSTQSLQAMSELKQETEVLSSKQRALLGGVDQLISLQTAIFGDFMDLKTIIFYSCAVLLALALTSTNRSAAARLKIFTVLCVKAL